MSVFKPWAVMDSATPNRTPYAESKTGPTSFWTEGGGRVADVIVATHDGRKYIKTTNDGVQQKNLLALVSFW